MRKMLLFFLLSGLPCNLFSMNDIRVVDTTGGAVGTVKATWYRVNLPDKVVVDTFDSNASDEDLDLQETLQKEFARQLIAVVLEHQDVFDGTQETGQKVYQCVPGESKDPQLSGTRERKAAEKSIWIAKKGAIKKYMLDVCDQLQVPVDLAVADELTRNLGDDEARVVANIEFLRHIAQLKKACADS